MGNSGECRCRQKNKQRFPHSSVVPFKANQPCSHEYFCFRRRSHDEPYWNSMMHQKVPKRRATRPYNWHRCSFKKATLQVPLKACTGDADVWGCHQVGCSLYLLPCLSVP
jgi:hypothetical protein